jgi:hypothetical protein
MSDPADLDTVREIEFRIRASVHPVVASEWSIARAIHYYYGDGSRSAENSREQPEDPTPAAPGDTGEEDAWTLDEQDAVAMMKLLVLVLRKKGIIDRRDLAEARRQMQANDATAYALNSRS